MLLLLLLLLLRGLDVSDATVGLLVFAKTAGPGSFF